VRATIAASDCPTWDAKHFGSLFAIHFFKLAKDNDFRQRSRFSISGLYF
jgi:hypothetical protein